MVGNVSESQSENTPTMNTATPVQSQVDQSLDNALLAARIADDFRGKDTLLLDMREITAIVDYFVITTTGSSRQMKALAQEADLVMKKRGSPRLGAEGEGETVWMLRDYGDVVLHIFSPEGRELYSLEDLWGDAPQVDWTEDEA